MKDSRHKEYKPEQPAQPPADQANTGDAKGTDDQVTPVTPAEQETPSADDQSSLPANPQESLSVSTKSETVNATDTQVTIAKLKEINKQIQAVKKEIQALEKKAAKQLDFKVLSKKAEYLQEVVVKQIKNLNK